MNAENLDITLLEEIEAYSIHVAKEAGQILLEHFRKPLEVQFKGKKKSDPVTTADHSSDEYLKKVIREKFPHHGILSEEGGALSQPDSPFIWVLDPLDGTSNFMNGMPLFAVSIGVLSGNRPVAGSIYVPVSHCATEGVYHACLGKGAFFNEERITIATEPSERPLSGTPAQFGRRFRLSGKSRTEPHETRNLGCIALELAMAACGVFQYALFGRPKLWDVAAGALLVKEAGGLVFTRSPKGSNWEPLEQFKKENENNTAILEDLQNWAYPLIAGAPDTATKVVKDIRIHHTPLSWLTTLRWLRGQKDRSQPNK